MNHLSQVMLVSFSLSLSVVLVLDFANALHPSLNLLQSLCVDMFSWSNTDSDLMRKSLLPPPLRFICGLFLHHFPLLIFNQHFAPLFFHVRIGFYHFILFQSVEPLQLWDY